MSRPLRWALLYACGVIVGCSNPDRAVELDQSSKGGVGSPVVEYRPPPNTAERIDLVVRPPAEDQPECLFELTEPWARDSILAHLGNVDWEQTGYELESTRMIRPDIEMRITDADGRVHHYEFSWGRESPDGTSSFIDYGNMRLIRADTEPFKYHIVGQLIRDRGRTE